MQGDGQENPGIIPLAIDHLFRVIREQLGKRDFVVRCSYLEIYNEIITDLLANSDQPLKVHETAERGVFVGGLTEELCSSSLDCLELFRRGELQRQIGATQMNERSSRSHTIFRLAIESRECATETGPLKMATLNLVDLAGSERAGLTGAEGTRLKEGGHINKSLLALSTVVSRLAEGKDKAHVPYRDSRLTRILQPSLGGNSRTAIICAITPASAFCEETLSTLKFASRAKAVKNRPHRNEILTDEQIIRRYREEIECLKARLEANKRPADEGIELDEEIALVKRIRIQPPPINVDALIVAISSMKKTIGSVCFPIPSLDELRILVKHLNVSLREAEEARATLEAELKRRPDLERENAMLMEQLAGLEESTLEHLAQLQEENEKLRGQDAAELQGLANEITTLRNLVAALEQQPREEKEALEDRIQVLGRDLQSSRADIEELLQSMAQIKKDARSKQDELEARVDLAERDREQALGCCQDAETRLLEMVQKLSEVTRQSEDDVRRIEELQRKIAEMESGREHLDQEKQLIVQQLAELSAKLDEKSKEVIESAALLHQFKSQFGALEAAKGSLEERVGSLIDQLESLGRARSQAEEELQAKLRHRETEVSVLRSELELSSQKLLTIQADALETRSQLLNAQRESLQMKEAQRQVDEQAQAMITDQKTQIERLIQERNLLQSSLDEQRKSYELSASKAQSLQASLETESEKLSARLAQVEEEGASSKLRLEGRLAELDGQVQATAADRDRLRDLCEKLKEQRDEFELQLEAARSRFEAEATDAKLRLTSEHAKEKAKLSDEVERLRKDLADSKPPSKSNEMLLRIELEKLKESIAKERKLHALKLIEMDELLEAERSRKSTSAPDEELARLRADVARLSTTNKENSYSAKVVASPKPKVAKSVDPAPECHQQ